MLIHSFSFQRLYIPFYLSKPFFKNVPFKWWFHSNIDTAKNIIALVTSCFSSMGF
jgi:hypothetical protein